MVKPACTQSAPLGSHTATCVRTRPDDLIQRVGTVGCRADPAVAAHNEQAGRPSPEARAWLGTPRRESRAGGALTTRFLDRGVGICAGKRPLKKDRFVRTEATGTEADWSLVDRARQLAGLKGYVTNLPESTMDGRAVVAAYHNLWQVEKSFRMAKFDLRRPARLPAAARAILDQLPAKGH
jgi:hypothetical protein